MSKIFSTTDQLARIAELLTGYLRLPFSGDSVPGALVESVISEVRAGEVLNTYDFVDVVNRQHKVGWQVKSTKAATPVTWKRAKIPNAARLIRQSREGEAGLQLLGDTIIDFCNAHVRASMTLYGLAEIGFARLIVHPDRLLTYFEKVLCSHQNPNIFTPDEFRWKWSPQRDKTRKEFLPALHGTHVASGNKWFAWHGLGENQLHFTGEKYWWPDFGGVPGGVLTGKSAEAAGRVPGELADQHSIHFRFPDRQLTAQEFIAMLSTVSRL